MILQRLLLLTILLASAGASSSALAAEPQPPQGGAPTGLQSDVGFTEYTPLSGAAEVTRRLMSPLNALRVSRTLQRSGKTLRDQVIDLPHEKFALYVPPTQPREGYALLVFVPPWPQAEVPKKWLSTLDRHGTIFVSAANTGNEADVLDRRDPLALLAVENVTRRFRVDPRRIYIGGFSGGSRVALRIALGYPDVFTGALLDAGSDPIGSAEIPLPPADLLQRFQETTRLVFLSGGHDDFHLQQDVESRRSLERWCVLDLVTQDMPRAEHELADASAFNSALAALADRKPRSNNKLAQCRARLDMELHRQLSQVETLVAAGKPAEAGAVLRKVDALYGGFAAPRSLELAQKAAVE
jgi:pimeloyl-ACP methyl ester carboxylesterase